MAAPNPLPQFVYKIHLATHDPKPQVAEIDIKDGFVHLSTAQQVRNTYSEELDWF